MLAYSWIQLQNNFELICSIDGLPFSLVSHYPIIAYYIIVAFANVMTEISLIWTGGVNDSIKREISYVRSTRPLLEALTRVNSKAVFEFGAGKGVFFFTFENETVFGWN